jgi:XTP/dITP diphosphohydrolase
VALAFVTGNQGKLAEARHLLDGITEIEQDPGGYTEIQADTLDAVAQAGLDDVQRRRAPPYFLEDAGLFIDALGGFPGVYSAYVFRTIGLDGILRLMAHLPDDERTARFEAVIAYRDEDHEDHFFHGRAAGHIARAPTGTGGFGYDPIFIPDGSDGRTFAEYAPDEKGSVSHRGAALRALIAHLTTTKTTDPHENPS